MAFENVNSTGKALKATEIAVGDSVTGYVTRFMKNENLGVTNIELQLENGEKLVLFPAGNIRYAVADGKIQQGLLTRFTRTADKMVKGKKSTQFTIEQDTEKTIGGAELDAAGITSDVAATGATSIKARAAKLASQVK